MKTCVFIDASNLFYGGEKSLGWKIDYNKLLNYLRGKYNVECVLFFGGAETYGFPYNYQTQESLSISELEQYLTEKLKNSAYLSDTKVILIGRHIQRVRFFKKLEHFGYTLFIKPVKSYEQEDGVMKRKANCDVDMAFYLMKEKENFDRVIVLSGDGDFLPVLKYLRNSGKEVLIMARGKRTAKEIRQFAGGKFMDFVRLEKHIRFEDDDKK
jgi:uncharacterized LabA/DUF88 family protein